MSNASLKEQLQAMASKLTDVAGKPVKPKQIAGNKSDKVNNRGSKKQMRVNSPKPKWLDYAQYGVELLRAYFPSCFKQSNEVKPLKKGIKQDLLLRLSKIEGIVTEDKACMVKSLSYYVNTITYHKSVIEGAERIDLDGQPAGVVTAEEAKYSFERNQAKNNTKTAETHAISIQDSVSEVN